MEEIIEQINALFLLEQKALVAYRKNDPSEYNALVKRLHAHSGDRAINFGLEPRTRSLDDFELMMFTKLPSEPLPRLLFKLSTFETKDYGTVYAVYTSSRGSVTSIKNYADCYVFQAGQDGLVAQALFQFDDKEGRQEHAWVWGHGNKNLRPESLRPAKSVIRFEAPTSPSNALEDYLTDY